MNNLIILFASLLSFNVICPENQKQNDYRLVLQYANITVIEPKYVEVHESSFRKINRTTGGFSMMFSFKEDLDNTFNVYVRGFLFKNNQFKQTVVDYNVNMCELLGSSVSYDIEHIMENSNLTLSCPIKKGTYYIRDMVPDATNFPAFLPSGFWSFKQILKVHGVKFAIMDTYVYVEYVSEVSKNSLKKQMQ